jgi:hypothetical protein
MTRAPTAAVSTYNRYLRRQRPGIRSITSGVFFFRENIISP